MIHFKDWIMVFLAIVLISIPWPGVFPAPVKETRSEALTGKTGEQELTITDALGREVYLEEPPERIILAGRAAALIANPAYIFPEAKEKIVGMSDPDQGMGNFIAFIDPFYGDKTIFQGTAGAEEVAALNPDLVIMKSFMEEKLGRPLSKLEIPVVYLNLETPQQFERDLQTLGKLFQNESRAMEIGEYYRREQEEVLSVTESIPEGDKPRVLLIYFSEQDGKFAFNVPPRNWIQTTMVKMAGGHAVWKDSAMGDGWIKVSFEQIAVWNPHHIYVVSYRGDANRVKGELLGNPRWSALKAVKNRNLYAFPGDFYSWDQPDPRWILGLKWLAKKLHPHLFIDIDMRQEAADFFYRLYNLEESPFTEKILPRIKGDFP
mgnify:CR=1 FL=1